MQEPVLVLNATFEPINVTAVRRAMVLLLKGVAQAEELNHAEVHSATKALKVIVSPDAPRTDEVLTQTEQEEQS